MTSPYQGAELPLFERAVRWKAYWSSLAAPEIRGSVLEAGAGTGATTELLASAQFDQWLCLEPDSALLQKIPHRSLPSPAKYEFLPGTLAGLDPARRFDTILYIDVLEHIANDRAEMLMTAPRLNPGGKLVVLSPAHPWLFSRFDQAIGHCRRYTKRSLQAASPPSLTLLKMHYLDSAGLLASAMNRLVLRQTLPTKAQILVWDRLLVPVSTQLDSLLGFSLGKSVLGIWERKQALLP